MKFHLISGFLGSGKTTAIVNSVKMLNRKGMTCAVITNDQGESLVDSDFVHGSGIPLAQVSGGCFCCNYDQFETNVWILKNKIQPDVIFAETVGSCTDLVATVLKPLWKFQGHEINQLTFSTFVDAQLLFTYLKGEKLPFSEDTSYIWEKQIEEAEILIVNKIDLISSEDLPTLKNLSAKNYPGEKLLFQNSHEENSLMTWQKLLNTTFNENNRTGIQIDYDRYGRGEAELAWLDEEINIESGNDKALMITHRLVDRLANSVFMNQLPVGHLKFLLDYNDQQIKISHTTILNRKLFNVSPPEKSNSVKIMVNARVQTSPEMLRSLVRDSVDFFSREREIKIREKNVAFFRPGMPKPTNRLD